MPIFTQPGTKIEYDFSLRFKGARNLNLDERITSPATDDFGHVHTFEGSGIVVAAETTHSRLPDITTTLYVMTYQTIALSETTVPKDLAEKQRKAFRGTIYKDEIDLIQ